MSVNKKYMILQGLFWSMFCVAGGFLSLNLQSRGLTNSEIGIVSALFGAMATILQPLFGRICDRSQSITWKKMLLVLIVPYIVSCGLQPFVTNKLAGAALVGMLVLLVNLILPFINSALAAYQSQNEYINFGVARGIGSASYAILAMLLGNLAAKLGVKAVSVSGLLLGVLFLLTVLSLPYKEEEKTESSAISGKSKGFVRKYPAFIVMCVGFMFLFVFHNLVNTYLLQIVQSFGGTEKEFGTAIAIQAMLEVPVLFLFSYIIKKVPSHTLMLVSAFGFGARSLWYALSAGILSVYLLQITQMFSFAIFASASVYYAADMTEEEDRVTGQALMASPLAVGALVAGPVGGIILDRYGVRTLLYTGVGIVAVGIVLALISELMLKKESHN